MRWPAKFILFDTAVKQPQIEFEPRPAKTNAFVCVP